MSLRFIYISARRFLSVIILCMSGAFAPAVAQNVIERLVSPGPLSNAHQELEKDCSSCHATFDKSAQTALCLDCHKDTSADVMRFTGFHGKSPDVQGKDCKTCHTEHEGLIFDIATFDSTLFDHSLTDYPLKGLHEEVECAACHLTDKKFRETPTDCASCHKSDEPHKDRLGDDCQDCHTVNDWKQVDFDHSTTDFPLLGKHRNTTCVACHVGEIYEELPAKCNDCHEEDDTHKGTFGVDCESCHDSNAWATIAFNHVQKTGFSLTGKHAVLECKACHTTTLFEPELQQTCLSCHQQDDDHQGLNGPDCADCHVTSDWRTSLFDHDTKTNFPLRGAHPRVACEACHLEPVTKTLPGVTCIDCHREDDVHEGGQGAQCSSCHNELSWIKNTVFDHDLSRFPLLGKHEAVECAECHLSKRFQEASVACESCHTKDDKHLGTLGEDCGLCHNPNSWSLWIFDHTIQTDFQLTGAHEGLDCASCHRNKSQGDVSQSRECIACHRADDKHRGQYGGNCGRCHTTTDFKTIRMP